MAVVQNQIACDAWLYSEFGKGSSTSYFCPPKSVITDTYGLTVSGNYANNQLVKQQDISSGLVEIPFYVVFNWHNVPYSSRWVKYQGRQVMPVYCNVQTDVDISNHSPGPNVTNGSYTLVVKDATTSNYDIGMNTSTPSSGTFQALPSDSYQDTKEYCMNVGTSTYVSPSSNYFAIPEGSKIRGITLKSVRVTFYDSSYNPIGTTGSVSTNFGYSLSIGVNEWGYWQPASDYWRDENGNTVTSSMVGFTRNYTLGSNSNLDSRFNLTPDRLTNDNRGIAIMFDFHDLYEGSGGDSSSS